MSSPGNTEGLCIHEFSFLLSTPIILGAALVKMPHLLAHPKLITAKSLLPFVVYRLALGVLVIVVAVMR